MFINRHEDQMILSIMPISIDRSSRLRDKMVCVDSNGLVAQTHNINEHVHLSPLGYQ